MESTLRAHEIGPKKGTVTDKDGNPRDLMMTMASYYPMLAECWTCGARIELWSFYGLWHHVPASDG